MHPEWLAAVSALYLPLCVATGWYAGHRLDTRYKGNPGSIALFYGLFCIVLPLIGIPLAFWLIRYQKTVGYESPLPQMNSIHLEAFFDIFPVIKRTFGEASLSMSMNDEHIPVSKRLVALTMLSEKTGKQSIGLIKQMLSSGNDELRLFSFSVVDAVEHSLHDQIHKAHTLIESDSSPETLRRLNIKKLAFLYWELVYLELADEVLTRFLLEEAVRYCQKALQQNPRDMELYLLLGKIALRRGDESAAETALQRAAAMKSTNDKNGIRLLQPYLAEIHYRKRRFDSVKAIISGSGHFRLHSTTDPVYRMWSR